MEEAVGGEGVSAGKGDKARPVNKREYDRRFDAIKWRSQERKPSRKGGRTEKS